MLWYLICNWQISETNVTDIWNEHDRYLKDVHEPPYINYRVIANRHDEFTPSEIDQLKYEAYTEFPLIKVLAKNVIINYNENRANINSAYIINSRDNDTTLVEFSYEGNKVVKRHYKSKRAKNIVRYWSRALETYMSTWITWLSTVIFMID